MRKRFYLNDNWKFSEEYSEDMIKQTYDDHNMEEVRIPHTCKELPYHYFDEKEYQMLCGYRKKIEVPKNWKNKHIELTFEGVAHDCEVYINGKKAGEHHCGYTAFSMDISDKLKVGEENLIVVKADSRETLNIPPFGNVIDYMTYGGIYRDVYIEVKEKNYIKDIFLHSELSYPEKHGEPVEKTKKLKIHQWQTGEVFLYSQVQLKQAENNFVIRQTLIPKKTDQCSIHLEKDKSSARIKDNNGSEHIKKDESLTQEKEQKLKEKEFVFESFQAVNQMEAEIDEKERINLQWKLKDIFLWDLENPALYDVKTELLIGGKVIDEMITTTNQALLDACAWADYYVQASGPGVVVNNIRGFVKHSGGKPYGILGVTYSGGKDVQEAINGADFCYFRDSVSLSKAIADGLTCPVCSLDRIRRLHLTFKTRRRQRLLCRQTI